ncbi:MAG TPA: hypothetical protein VH796_06980 [Nitrososphaeraceae archaeon]
MNFTRRIIDRYVLNDVKCCKFLTEDGITTSRLAIESVEGIFEGFRIDTSRETIPPIFRRACGILKNLDDYQYIVCSEIRSIPDSNRYKKILQKYRVTIVAAFVKFILTIHSRVIVALHDWTHFAQQLLTGISNTLANARINSTTLSNNDQIGSMFDYFGMSSNEVDELLDAIY